MFFLIKMKRWKVNNFSFYVNLFLFVLSWPSSNAEEVSVTLNFGSLPQQIILLNATGDLYRVSVNDSKYKVSVVLEIMSVDACRKDGNGGNVSRALTLMSDGWNNTLSICDNVDYTGSSFQNMSYFIVADRFAIVRSEGTWLPGDYAKLVASVFYEESSCDDCGTSFCCGEGDGETCGGSEIVAHSNNWASGLDVNWESYVPPVSSGVAGIVQGNSGRLLKKVRCIPWDAVCNSHANCGQQCNADEAPDTCNCYNYEHWQSSCMSFYWTVLLAILFFVLAPTMTVFLICYHRQFRLLRRQQRHFQSHVTVSSPVNDLPPTYDEIEEPPPCFCTATSTLNLQEAMEDGGRGGRSEVDSRMGGGVDNPGFSPHYPLPPPTVTCTCGRAEEAVVGSSRSKALDSDESDLDLKNAPRNNKSRFSMKEFISRVSPSRFPGRSQSNGNNQRHTNSRSNQNPHGAANSNSSHPHPV